jgi:3D (Asp-Asp-Asp) domain-containing protein
LFKKFALTALTLLLAFFLPHALHAQDSASITGIVTDASGAVIPSVKVTLTNPATGVSYQGVTSAEGSYTINEVKPGPGYTATFSHEGFTSVSVTGLYLNVSAVRTQNVSLTVGNVVTTVAVSGSNENVTLDTTDATIGNNFEVQMVNQLPVQIRDTPFALFTLQPGVAYNPYTGDGSVTGSRADQTHVTLDGLDVDDRGTGQFGNVNGNAPVDSVQEFRGVEAGQTAGYDSAGGGQFQLVTKSGTNQFHGALFEYHRDTNLEANDWFNNNAGVDRAPLIRNQFGGNLGGPILRDKAFFFFEYNGRRDNQGISVEQTVPTASYLAGNISYVNNNAGCSPFSTLQDSPQCISTISASQVAANYDPLGIGQNPALASFIAGRYPAGNDATGGDGINTTGFRFNAPINRHENDYVARLDYNLTSSQKIFIRANALSERTADGFNYPTPIQFPGDPVTRSIDDATWAWVVGHNWVIGANKTNQVSFGETRSRLNFPALYNPTGALLWSFGPLTAPYLGNYNAQSRVVPVPQWRDDFSWIKGSHTLQFGGTFKYPTPFNNLVLNDFTPSLGLGGASGLTELDPSLRPADINQSVSSFPTNNWDSALVFDLGSYNQIDATYNYNADGSLVTPGTGTDRNYRYYETELYFGDSWKVKPALTLTYGVRYQLYTVPYETHGIEAIQVNAATGKPLGFDDYFFKNILPQSAAGVSGPTSIPFLEYVLAGKANHATGYYQPSYKDFAPHVSFAWNPSFDRATVVNGSVGLVYDHTIVSAVQNYQDHSSYLFQSGNNIIYGDSSDPEGSLANDPRFTSINSLAETPAAPAFSSTSIPYVDTTTDPPTPYGLGINTFSTAIDPNLKTPYSIMLNAGVQHSFPGGFLLNVSYAGRLGRRLLAQVDGSQVTDFKDPASGQGYANAFGNVVQELRNGDDPGSIPAEPWFENQVGSGGTQFLASVVSNLFIVGDIADFTQAIAGAGFLNPNVAMASQFSSNDYYTNKGSSNYHGLLTTLHKNAGHGLQFDFNYTWSHSIDNFSLVANGQSNYTGEFLCDATKPRECRGNSDFDITQVFNGNFIYDLPFGHGRSFAATTPTWADEIIGGWQISGLPTWQTGLPFYANTGAYGASYANLAPAILLSNHTADVASHPHKDPVSGRLLNFKDTAAANAAFVGPIGLTLGQRNELRGPHYTNLDLGVGKTFPLFSENYKLVFRADAFNAFNHPNFDILTSTGANLTSSSFGRLGHMASPSRVLQGALRFEF